MLEKFLNTLPEEVRVFIRGRQPKSSRLADDYYRARKENQVGKRSHRDKSGDKVKVVVNPVTMQRTAG